MSLIKKLITIISVFSLSTISADDFIINSSINANYGNSYDFYDFSENILDINFFYNDLQGWIQYEYSNPPDIGFLTNDIRKFRLEYTLDNWTVKLGDIYEFWGRGLTLNQFDDQVTNFDNGIRGLYLEHKIGPFSISHLNGNSNIWLMGVRLRVPDFNNIYSTLANRIQYDWDSISFGITKLRANEDHDVMSGPSQQIGHNIVGTYMSWVGRNSDIFLEYVDKVSTHNTSSIFENTANDTLKKGHGYYQNLNFYFGNWGISTEYKRYAFDKKHDEFNANDFGNQIEYQQMPTLGREHNSTLLNRITHNYNFNDERGVQLEVNGTINGLSIVAQYAHLSRNEAWQSISVNNWIDIALENYLPSAIPSSLPYWENYQELSGYLFNDKLYFKIGRGSNREILNTTFYFEGYQKDMITNSYWSYDTSTYSYWGNDYQIIDSVEVFDTLYSEAYNVESKFWQESKAFTIPMEITYTLNNGYTLGIGFHYQERKKYNVQRGNATSYNSADSLWRMYNPDNYSEYQNKTTTQLFDVDGPVETQYNRLGFLTLSKAPKWSFTITHDWTNAYEEGVRFDPYYNPLEAFIYGDIKYFYGKRNYTNPPNWVQNRWVSAEFTYNITPTQRLSVMYGSIKGGLFCSNGICRVIPAFNDGFKVNYSASF